jgi:hypothetical protein
LFYFDKTDQHAGIVYKLRNLVEGSTGLTSSLNRTQEIKSSQTLQIIQSRLAYKQQMYAEALLRKTTAALEEEENESASTSVAVTNAATSPTYLSPIGSFPNKFGYTSDDDNESFVSADSVSR